MPKKYLLGLDLGTDSVGWFESNVKLGKSYTYEETKYTLAGLRVM